MIKAAFAGLICCLVASAEVAAQDSWKMSQDGRFRFGYQERGNTMNYSVAVIECDEKTKVFDIQADSGPKRHPSGRGTLTLQNSAGLSASISSMYDAGQPFDGHYWIGEKVPRTHPIFEVLGNPNGLRMLDSSGRRFNLSSAGLGPIMQRFKTSCR